MYCVLSSEARLQGEVLGRAPGAIRSLKLCSPRLFSPTRLNPAQASALLDHESARLRVALTNPNPACSPTGIVS